MMGLGPIGLYHMEVNKSRRTEIAGYPENIAEPKTHVARESVLDAANVGFLKGIK